ncbi:LEA type 2 family protein [Haloarcula sp. S1CR25-12]|uniref:LEA type 2 family protein n=1 Tax=Haloarcula saliterrae TaxID=2950534 RepID=A0ABU2FBT0_9EURY|nr:LEA type 2 family protein [Haloarcula sp. S1CR25-12]MDS0259723.1 LEA type 2 family protein [Haloarcula sp. S1CR25-12]
MVRRRGVVVAAVAAGLLLLGAAVYGLAVVDRPRVQSVDNSWGTVTAERTEVVSDIRVDNPLLLRLGDGVADVRYNVTLNGVRMASGVERGVRLGGSDDVVTVRTWLDNDKIQPWWVSHVNRNETTTVRVDPEVRVDYAGVDLPAEEATRTRTVRTDLLEPLNTERNRSVAVFGRTALVVEETSARWGEATRARTPIRASTTVTNELPVAVPLTDVRYTIRMNGIVVGRGTAAGRTVIPAESTRQVALRADIDNSKLDEWWVTHRRRNGSSRLSVAFDATVGYRDVDRRVTLDGLTYNRTFRTDIFDEESNGSATPGTPAVRGSPARASRGAT